LWCVLDLADRALALAEHARTKPDPKREAMRRCPELVAWVRTLNAAIDGRVELLRAWDADGYCYGEPDRGRWVAVSAPPLMGKGKRGR
jgi:hypothetical protein